jgi:hypothetical protein
MGFSAQLPVILDFPAYVRDDKGNPVALDAAGRQARLAEAQGNVSSYCTQ